MSVILCHSIGVAYALLSSIEAIILWAWFCATILMSSILAPELWAWFGTTTLIWIAHSCPLLRPHNIEHCFLPQSWFGRWHSYQFWGHNCEHRSVTDSWFGRWTSVLYGIEATYPWVWFCATQLGRLGHYCPLLRPQNCLHGMCYSFFVAVEFLSSTILVWLVHSSYFLKAI